MSEPVYYLCGEFVGRDRAVVSALDRAFVMGDAVYEVTRVHRGRLFLERTAWSECHRRHHGRVRVFHQQRWALLGQ